MFTGASVGTITTFDGAGVSLIGRSLVPGFAPPASGTSPLSRLTVTIPTTIRPMIETTAAIGVPDARRPYGSRLGGLRWGVPDIRVTPRLRRGPRSVTHGGRGSGRPWPRSP